MFMFSQSIVILLYGLCTKLSDYTDPMSKKTLDEAKDNF